MKYVRRVEGNIVAVYSNQNPNATESIQESHSEYLAFMLQPLVAEKIDHLNSRLIEKIASGFDSDALGSQHHYDSEQHNIDWIQSCSMSSSDMPITCDDGSSKQPRQHTTAQAIQVLNHGMYALLAHKTQFRTLRDQVTAIVADDVTYPNYDSKKTAIEAVAWP